MNRYEEGSQFEDYSVQTTTEQREKELEELFEYVASQEQRDQEIKSVGYTFNGVEYD